MEFSEEYCHSESESGSQFSDDSQNDPNFDIEETQLTLSNLSLKGKSKTSKLNCVEEGDELDEKDKKSYEIIKEMIEGGQVERLKVDECKIYLRKHGLRLSGKKDILIQRIKEHVDIVNGGGEDKYPPSSFVLNCKGDACKGDVVIFEQNVYDEFSIVSRSSKGGLCGTRIVAGRILKESYGAAKQQHTFTIEVLWSKGEKPLPPLHPLLIKGRNLYRLKTMRQKWEDEGERQRILLEKHARGGAARSNREARIQQKEKRQTQRAAGNEHPNGKQEYKRRKPDEQINRPQQQQHEAHFYTATRELNIPAQPVNPDGNPNYSRRPPLMATNCNFQRAQNTDPRPGVVPILKSSTQEERHLNYPTYRSPDPRIFPSYPNHPFKENTGYSQQGFAYHMQNTNAVVGSRPVYQQGREKQQKCRYFGQGRCHFGDRCKFLHELTSNR
ncbi:zinc finger CCCH domain-containing protein 62-like [Salvia divinorum]|uniref:Zinc finger CCCH domain-containing protein 62-like n=1 Tax=Salvia divinorum TaxID=28513 RepID=A0ABD1G1X5_SALDI